MAAKDNNVFQKGVIAALGGDPEKCASSALRRCARDFFVNPVTGLKKNGVPVLLPDDLCDAHRDRHIPCFSENSIELDKARIYLNQLRRGLVELTQPIFNRILIGMIALIVLVVVIGVVFLYLHQANEASGDNSQTMLAWGAGLLAFVGFAGFHAISDK